MKLADLLIIYFACGAPFGVYQITVARRPFAPMALVQVISRVLFWPIFAATTVIEWLFASNQHAYGSVVNKEVEDIGAEIEWLAREHKSVSSIFDFREILHRYTGLCEASNAGTAPDAHYELYGLISKGNADISSACLARLNERKLSFHHSLVRNEFVEMMSSLADIDSEREQILTLAVAVANIVNDRETATLLAAMIPQSETAPSERSPASRIPALESHSVSNHI